MQGFDHKDITEENAKKREYPCWMCEHGCKMWDQEGHKEHCRKCTKSDFDDKPSEFMLKGRTYMRADVFPADGIFLENVSSEGKRFFSKKEMKAYAKKNDIEIGYLE